MQLLVDMDGVLADFESGFLKQFRLKYPEHPFVPVNDRRTFYVSDEYPPDLALSVREIYCAANFYRDLPPIPGGLEAMQEMSRRGVEVFICSSPLGDYQNCVAEKYDWIVRHLGIDWSKRLILTKDKTVILGDVLIDDRPSVEGVATPRWEHVIYDQPYNRDVMTKRRLTWENWQEVLGTCK